MKIAIFRQDGNIVTVKDYSDIDQKGEVSHMIAELENIKLDLLELWEELNHYEDED